MAIPWVETHGVGAIVGSDRYLEAEDANGQIFPMAVEFFGSVPNFGWLKQVIVKLPNEIANSGEIRISLKVRGTRGNKVIVKLKP